MLHRPDKKRLPISYIPNGSGNDTATVFTVDSPNKALDYLIKGDTVKMDIERVLVDYERVEDIPPEEVRSHIKYQLDIGSFSMLARILAGSFQYKARWGNTAYTIAALKGFTCDKKRDFFNLYQDDELFEENIELNVLLVSNVNYVSAALTNPLAFANDGFVELHYSKNKIGSCKLIKLLDQCKKEGT